MEIYFAIATPIIIVLIFIISYINDRKNVKS
jgi:hypothetical protein